MTTFDDRDKSFENKFAHDEELNFKATALCNRMAGMWAAGKMGKNEAESEAYARSIIEAEFATGGHAALEAKLVSDLNAAGIPATAKEVHREIARLMPVAMTQLMGQKN